MGANALCKSLQSIFFIQKTLQRYNFFCVCQNYFVILRKILRYNEKNLHYSAVGIIIPFTIHH